MSEERKSGEADVETPPAKPSYYFFESTPAEKAHEFAPKRVDNAQTVSNAVDESGGKSAWNNGNTWEERDLSKWAKETIESLFKGITIPCSGEDEITIDKVEVGQTHASIVFVRGKKRHGYDLSATVNWKGTIRGSTVEGKIKFPEIADDVDNDDVEANVTAKESDASHETARMAVRKSLAMFRAKILEFDTTFRSK